MWWINASEPRDLAGAPCHESVAFAQFVSRGRPSWGCPWHTDAGLAAIPLREVRE
jgi:hypothetical protein